MNENINDFSDVLEQKRHFDRDFLSDHVEPTYTCASCGEEKVDGEFESAHRGTGLCQCSKCEQKRQDLIADIRDNYHRSFDIEMYTRMDQLRLKHLARREYFENYYVAMEKLETKRAEGRESA